MPLPSPHTSLTAGVLADPTTGRPVKVNLNAQKFPLSSNLPVEAFQQMTSFRATSVTGQYSAYQMLHLAHSSL